MTTVFSKSNISNIQKLFESTIEFPTIVISDDISDDPSAVDKSIIDQVSSGRKSLISDLLHYLLENKIVKPVLSKDNSTLWEFVSSTVIMHDGSYPMVFASATSRDSIGTSGVKTVEIPLGIRYNENGSKPFSKLYTLGDFIEHLVQSISETFNYIEIFDIDDLEDPISIDRTVEVIATAGFYERSSGFSQEAWITQNETYVAVMIFEMVFNSGGREYQTVNSSIFGLFYSGFMNSLNAEILNPGIFDHGYNAVLALTEDLSERKLTPVYIGGGDVDDDDDNNNNNNNNNNNIDIIPSPPSGSVGVLVNSDFDILSRYATRYRNVSGVPVGATFDMKDADFGISWVVSNIAKLGKKKKKDLIDDSEEREGEDNELLDDDSERIETFDESLDPEDLDSEKGSNPLGTDVPIGVKADDINFVAPEVIKSNLGVNESIVVALRQIFIMIANGTAQDDKIVSKFESSGLSLLISDYTIKGTDIVAKSQLIKSFVNIVFRHVSPSDIILESPKVLRGLISNIDLMAPEGRTGKFTTVNDDVIRTVLYKYDLITMCADSGCFSTISMEGIVQGRLVLSYRTSPTVLIFNHLVGMLKTRTDIKNWLGTQVVPGILREIIEDWAEKRVLVSEEQLINIVRKYS